MGWLCGCASSASFRRGAGGRAVQLGVPPVRGAGDLGSTMAAITTAATSGAITPGEATELARVVEIYVRAIETSDFERRLRELEEAQAARAAAR
jgi:hypothetical protein